MGMLILAAVLPLLLGVGDSGRGMRLSSESSIGLIARGNAVAFKGCTLAVRDCIIALGDLGAAY